MILSKWSPHDPLPPRKTLALIGRRRDRRRHRRPCLEPHNGCRARPPLPGPPPRQLPPPADAALQLGDPVAQPSTTDSTWLVRPCRNPTRWCCSPHPRPGCCRHTDPFSRQITSVRGLFSRGLAHARWQRGWACSFDAVPRGRKRLSGSTPARRHSCRFPRPTDAAPDPLVRPGPPPARSNKGPMGDPPNRPVPGPIRLAAGNRCGRGDPKGFGDGVHKPTRPRGWRSCDRTCRCRGAMGIEFATERHPLRGGIGRPVSDRPAAEVGMPTPERPFRDFTGPICYENPLRPPQGFAHPGRGVDGKTYRTGGNRPAAQKGADGPGLFDPRENFHSADGRHPCGQGHGPANQAAPPTRSVPGRGTGLGAFFF